MQETDDFGDLYADVEVRVNAGSEGVNHLYVEEGKENDGNGKWVFNSNSQKEDVKVDAVSEELVLCDQIPETNDDDKNVSGEDSKVANFEAGDGNLIVEDGSESEDDLHIVLNDEDCRVFSVSQGVCAGSGGRAGRSDDEDGDDDLVIVTEADHPNKDRRPIDGFEQSSGGPGADRVNVSKGVYVSQYSQFKYVRPHAAAFPSNSKTSGSAGMVSFSSPMFGRSDRDVDGGKQQMMSCSGFDTSACNLGIPAITQKAFDFHLPRNRTILDVSIETFEWKPWRHPGVDITDFFNFGLDEESWKCYCKSLEHFRQQTTMLTKIPVYESSWPNQAYESEFLKKTADSEAVSGKIIEQGDRISSMSDSVYRGARSFEMPKGRAIQVEGGIGERRPSMDVRRPRYRDSDVVIQIPMQDTMEDSSVSNEEELEYVDESLENVHENGAIVKEDNRSMQRCGSADGDLVGCLDQKVIEPVFKETSELETVDRRESENFSKGGTTTLEADSTSHVQQNLSPSYLQSHSEASKAGVAVDMDKAYNHDRSSSSSLTGSEHHQSNDSRSDISKTEPKGNKDSSREQSPIQDERNSCGTMRDCNVAELEIPMDSTKVSTRANRKGRYDGDHMRRGTRKGRHHNYHFDDSDSIDGKCYYRETEISIGYRGRKLVEKQERRNSYTELHRKSEPHFREEMGPYVRRDLDERGYHDERFTAGDAEIKHREYYFHERGRNGECTGVITHKESDLLNSENTSFQSDRERYLQLRRRNENDRWFSKGAEDDDFVFEHRYKEEFLREKYERNVLYYGTEEDFIQEKYGRRVPHRSREKERSDKRERDAQSPCFGLDCSWEAVEYDDMYRRKPYHPSQTCRELHITDGRGCIDSDPPGNHAYDSWRFNEKYKDHWRSNERYADHWRKPDLQDKQSNKQGEEGYFSYEGKEHHYQSLHRRDIDFCEDSCHADEMSVYTNNDVCDERKRYRWQWTDEEASFGHRERDGLYQPEACFLLERSSRHEYSCLNHDSAHDRKRLDDFKFDRSRNKITVEKSVDYEASKRISSDSDITDWGKREAAVLRCREPVNLHLNGWEGKHLRRCSEAEVRCRRYDNTAHVDNEEQMTIRQFDEVITMKAAPVHMSKVDRNRLHVISSKVERVGHCNSEHATDLRNEKWLDKFPIVQHQDDSVLEEGELPEEPENKEAFNQLKKLVFDKKAPSWAAEVSKSENTEENRPQSKDAADDNKGVGGYDNHRILQTLAKMERRRERFKEPIALKKESNKNLQPQCDVAVETAEVKQQRPARKRRWGGS